VGEEKRSPLAGEDESSSSFNEDEGELDGIGSTTASVTTTDCATGFTAPSGSLFDGLSFLQSS